MKIQGYIDKSTVYSIIANGRLLEKIIDSKITETKLSYYQTLILISLSVEAQKDIYLTDLANTFPISKGAISQTLSLLESLGFVKRKPTHDKRRNMLIVTKKGEVEAMKLQAILERFEQEVDSKTDFTEVQKIKSYLADKEV